MIESSNPEIDVNALMERVQREARNSIRLQSGGGRAAVRPAILPEIPEIAPLPEITLSGRVASMKAGMSDLLRKMQRMINVSRKIPKLFRGFFRRQGGFNQTLVEAVAALAETTEALTVRVRELSEAAEAHHGWLRELAAQRQTELAFLQSAQDNLSQFTLLQTQLERQSELVRLLQIENRRIEDLQGQADRAGEHLRNLQSETERSTQDVRVLREMLVHLDERQINDGVYLKGELAQHSAQLRRPERARVGSQEEGSPISPPQVEMDAHQLDAFYLSFENRFRGSRADIKERIRFYLPILREAAAGTPGRPVLDVGCGRGEWLELLREDGLEAAGVDLNKAMVAQCAARNLSVTQADAVAYLRSLPDESQGAVTGFHIIEHLPLETLMAFFAEAQRVLQPGGLAVFESPNCKNLVVGACNFNVDPTHTNPVFPETAEFMLDVNGFEKIEIKYLSPVDTRHIPGAQDLWPVLRELLYGPQDFAVIGRKPIAP
jgi:O-antigen chain-terminating methyltransferase